jgi:hypothetical protein
MSKRPTAQELYRYESRRKVCDPPVLPIPMRNARLVRGLSLRQLADLLPDREDGKRWGKTFLGYVETGAREASPELLKAIADALLTWDAHKLPYAGSTPVRDRKPSAYGTTNVPPESGADHVL